MLFPAGVSAGESEGVRHALQHELLSAATVRQVIGMVDQRTSPSPFVVRMSADDVVYVELDGVQVALDRADQSVSAAIIRSGQWEPHVERVLRAHLAPGSVFIDIGANVGWHTALAASIVGTTGRVYAIEPNPDNARLIALTIERNGLAQVRLLPFALSESIGFAAFRSAIGSNGGFTGSDASESIDPSVTIVPTVRLDDLGIDRVDVIKIDVEGAEPMVLRGATSMIERDHPVIVFEFSCEMTERVAGVAAREHLRLFEAFGYELSLIEQPSGELVPVPDVDALLRDWGNPLRLEDLVAVHRSASRR
ncbi:MAG: FkbM family methyltransferase [Ilumatobacteraceae bacterium]